MVQVRCTPEAEEDLIRIGSYIAADNPSAALRWVDAIEAVCDLLATQPGIGQQTRTKRFGDVRRHVVGNYLIYYEAASEGIVVIRVVHGARDQGNLL